VLPSLKTIGEDLGKIAQFNPTYVGDMGKVCKALTGAGKPVIHHMGGNPSMVTFPGREDLFCLLMPMRADMLDTAQLGFMRDHVGQNKAETLAAAAKRA
jgi:hypothetical protein